MPITPIARQSVSSEVFRQLAGEILAGRLAAGESLSSERELADAFAVNRHAVREAVKRLEQLGLVRVTHGGATRVLAWRENARLEALVEVARAGVVPPRAMLRDIAAARLAIGVDAVRLCAMRRRSEDVRQLESDSSLSRIRSAATEYEAATGAAVIEANRVFWTAVIAGSGNVVYQLAYNSLLAGIETIATIDEDVAAQFTAPAEHGELAALIAVREVDAAAERARELLSRWVTELEKP